MGKDIREEIRAAIGDDDPADETFTDQQLNIFIKASLKRLGVRVGMAIAITNGVLAPAATAGESGLISLQAQCIIAQRQFRTASLKGVKVSQDESSVDTSAGLGGLRESVSGAGSPCQQLEDLIREYLAKIAGAVETHGTAVWSGNSRIYEDVDHDGQHSERIFKPGPGGYRDKDVEGNQWWDDRWATEGT
jgi:hypothetical protein